MPEVSIHPTAIVAEGARIGPETVVGPYTIIGPDVVIGARNTIGPHVVIEGRTTLGDENRVFQFASVGSAPQDLKYRNEPSTVTIGSRNLIREYVTIQPGTEGGGMRTVIGDGNLFMANSHVGHDGIVGSGNVFANSAALAGHVTVGSHVVVGGLVGIHQFAQIGDFALIGAGAMVTKDVAPFCIAQGDRARLIGVNVVALRRAKMSEQEVRLVRRAYRALFLGEGTMALRIAGLRSDVECAESAVVQKLLAFVEASKRGVTIPAAGARESGDTE